MPNHPISRRWSRGTCSPARPSSTGNRPNDKKQQYEIGNGIVRKHDQSQHRPHDHDNRDFNDALQLLVEAAHRLRHVGAGKLRICGEFFFAVIGRVAFPPPAWQLQSVLATRLPAGAATLQGSPQRTLPGIRKLTRAARLRRQRRSAQHQELVEPHGLLMPSTQYSTSFPIAYP
jgi:hypothetical protein